GLSETTQQGGNDLPLTARAGDRTAARAGGLQRRRVFPDGALGCRHFGLGRDIGLVEQRVVAQHRRCGPGTRGYGTRATRPGQVIMTFAAVLPWRLLARSGCARALAIARAPFGASRSLANDRTH